MSSTGRHVTSSLFSFGSSASSEGTSDPRPLSDKFILGIALAIGVFICFVSALANAFLLSTRVPSANVFMKVNAAGGVVAILLVWKLLRWSRERNALIRQRDTAAEALNHEIRNAIHVIYMETYVAGEEVSEPVKQNIARIDEVLKQYAPMPAMSSRVLHRRVRTRHIRDYK
jgi:hypothetical protein